MAGEVARSLSSFFLSSSFPLALLSLPKHELALGSSSPCFYPNPATAVSSSGKAGIGYFVGDVAPFTFSPSLPPVPTPVLSFFSFCPATLSSRASSCLPVEHGRRSGGVRWRGGLTALGFGTSVLSVLDLMGHCVGFSSFVCRTAGPVLMILCELSYFVWTSKIERERERDESRRVERV